jgi:hypothetical protein
LVPATLTNDTVVQDPGQVFDPADGFSDAHTFELSDAAHFRVAIPPEATEPEADLDVYVVDPNGDLVASSTNGGTDELVDIPQPADGTWTVYVHGWTTANRSPGDRVSYCCRKRGSSRRVRGVSLMLCCSHRNGSVRCPPVW